MDAISENAVSLLKVLENSDISYRCFCYFLSIIMHSLTPSKVATSMEQSLKHLIIDGFQLWYIYQTIHKYHNRNNKLFRYAVLSDSNHQYSTL